MHAPSHVSQQQAHRIVSLDEAHQAAREVLGAEEARVRARLGAVEAGAPGALRAAVHEARVVGGADGDHARAHARLVQEDVPGRVAAEADAEDRVLGQAALAAPEELRGRVLNERREVRGGAICGGERQPALHHWANFLEEKFLCAAWRPRSLR